MSAFEKAAVKYFTEEVGEGRTQRLDGIQCFSPLSRFWFLKLRLDLLVSRGVLARTYHSSIFRSARIMPWYGLPAAKAELCIDCGGGVNKPGPIFGRLCVCRDDQSG